MNLTKQEKIDFLNHRILSFKLWLDLEKQDLLALISEGSIKIAEVELDIANKQIIIDALEDALMALTIGS
jgi:hypothetical protein